MTLRLPIAVAAAALAAAVPAHPGQAAQDPNVARAVLKELIDPAPLDDAARRQVPRLLAELGSDIWAQRDRAFKALLAVGPKAAPLVRPAADSAEPELAARARQLLEAYRAAEDAQVALAGQAVNLLVDRGDKAAVDAVVALLGHDDAGLRRMAEYGLRRMAGRDFGYRAHAPAAERRAAAARVAAWWQAARATFDFASVRPQAAGVLFWGGQAGRQVLLIGLDGSVLWSRPLDRTPSYVEALPNGHLLLAFSSGGGAALQEHDSAGRIVWQAAEDLKLRSYLRQVSRLTNGNTLVVEMHGRVVEIDRSGNRIVWQHDCSAGYPTAAERLANGNTRVCLQASGLAEVTPDGKVARHVAVPGFLRHAQWLPNGNVLISDPASRRVSELTADGKEVWAWLSPPNGRPVAAGRLPDGRTVIQVGGIGLIVVDAAGTHCRDLTTQDLRVSGCLPQMSLAPAPAEGDATGQ